MFFLEWVLAICVNKFVDKGIAPILRVYLTPLAIQRFSLTFFPLILKVKRDAFIRGPGCGSLDNLVKRLGPNALVRR